MTKWRDISTAPSENSPLMKHSVEINQKINSMVCEMKQKGYVDLKVSYSMDGYILTINFTGRQPLPEPPEREGEG